MDNAIRASLFAVAVLLIGGALSLFLWHPLPIIYGFAVFMMIIAVLVFIEALRR